MDGRLAVKLQDEKTAIWCERHHSNLYRNPQSLSLLNTCKKTSTAKESFTMKDNEEKEGENIITGSLAEVYEKALANVLNIQPTVNMEENSYGQKTQEKKSTDTSDARIFIPPEFAALTSYKHPYYRQNDTRNLSPHQTKLVDGKKINTTTKSAFHVPEKRRQSNGLSRHPSWTPDHRFAYPVSYPGDYYPVVNPSAFYSRGSPYHGAFVDRMNYYSVPRGHEYPVFNHMLPWTPFDRDYKPCASPRYRDWRPKEASSSPERDPGQKTYREKALKESYNGVEEPRVPRPGSYGDKTAARENAGINQSEATDKEKRKLEKGSESPQKVHNHMDYNVKTRRMRAFQKRSEVTKENKKTAFDSPKEEFLFCLGLTRVQ